MKTENTEALEPRVECREPSANEAQSELVNSFLDWPMMEFPPVNLYIINKKP